jgi:hypothetical protein
MASPQLEFVPAQAAPTAQATLYTSPVGTVTRIDKVSVANNGTAAATISINLVPSGQTAAGTNCTTPPQAVQPGQTWNSPNEYGHYLMPGDQFSVLASASTLTIAAGGTQIS